MKTQSEMEVSELLALHIELCKTIMVQRADELRESQRCLEDAKAKQEQATRKLERARESFLNAETLMTEIETVIKIKSNK